MEASEMPGTIVWTELFLLIIDCSDVMARFVWARDQLPVSKSTSACLDGLSCRRQTEDVPCTQPNWLQVLPFFLDTPYSNAKVCGMLSWNTLAWLTCSADQPIWPPQRTAKFQPWNWVDATNVC